jgi:translation initiation factor IF-1
VTAHVAGRQDVSVMRVLVGDRVRLELSPIDVQRGRIVEKMTDSRTVDQGDL